SGGPSRLSVLLRRPQKLVGNHPPVDRFGRVGGNPADDVRFETALAENVPNRLARAGRAAHRPDAAGVRQWLRETANAVLVRAFAGGDGRPQHRRKHRLQGGQIAAHSALNELRQGGHLPALQQRINRFPIRRVPADQQYFFSGGLSHSDASFFFVRSRRAGRSGMPATPAASKVSEDGSASETTPTVMPLGVLANRTCCAAAIPGTFLTASFSLLISVFIPSTFGFNA